MRNYSIDKLSEEIKNEKSKEYFDEVKRSYYSNNYRSAIVMLYSIVICDLVFKLQELKDQFNDEKADEILNEIEILQNKNPTSSKWENKLIELIKDQTNILEHSDYQNIQHLQNHRHLCAHPVILQNYQLYSPKKETVRAHIINILDGLLVKPALLSKRIFEEFLSNLSEIKEILITEKDISKHLNAKYFENLSLTTEKDIFRSLWKIVFSLDDELCTENRDINFKALQIILDRNYDIILDYIKNDNLYFSNNINLNLFDVIMRFLIKNPRIKESLNDSAQTLIVNKISQDKNHIFLAWFLNNSLTDHFKFLKDKKSNEFDSEIYTKTIVELYNVYKAQNQFNESRELLIEMYSRCRTFDQADSRFETLIYPMLQNFSLLELTEIIKAVDKNGQINGRRFARSSNNHIKEQMDKLNPVFDYSQYPDFRV